MESTGVQLWAEVGKSYRQVASYREPRRPAVLTLSSRGRPDEGDADPHSRSPAPAPPVPSALPQPTN